jgi:hypothetical protein
MLLRRCAPPAVADDGFSTRVLAALPASSTRIRTSRTVLVALATVAGTALAATGLAASGGPGAISAIVDDRLETLKAALSSAPGPTGPALGLAVLTIVVTLLYVFRPRLGRRLGMAF